MLRPMGQLEAFVNTISMVTAAHSLGSAASVISTTTTSSAELNSGESVGYCDPKNKEAVLDIPENNVIVDEPKEDEDDSAMLVESVKEQVGGEGDKSQLSSASPRKREPTPIVADVDEVGKPSEFVESPAKRMRLEEDSQGDEAPFNTVSFPSHR